MKYSKKDSQYALRWAKVIKGINLLGGKCIRCGFDNVFALVFHHKEGNTKDFEMADKRGIRWSVMKAEILKCDLLCRNCHLEYHYPVTHPLKSKLIEIKGINKCQRCSYKGKSLSSLDFHHNKGEKKFRIGKAYNNHRFNYPLEEIILEMEKCEVICRNCHAIEHIDNEKNERLMEYIYIKINGYKERRASLDKVLIKKMYFDQGMRQADIVRHFDCSKAAISNIIKQLKENMLLW